MYTTFFTFSTTLHLFRNVQLYNLHNVVFFCLVLLDIVVVAIDVGSHRCRCRCRSRATSRLLPGEECTAQGNLWAFEDAAVQSAAPTETSSVIVLACKGRGEGGGVCGQRRWSSIASSARCKAAKDLFLEGNPRSNGESYIRLFIRHTAFTRYHFIIYNINVQCIITLLVFE